MPAFDIAFALAPREWQGLFSRSTLERGRGYWRCDHVRKVGLRWEDDVLLLAGKVQGTARKPYEVLIQISGEPGDLFFDTSCDCPVGYECKHAVAVLLAAGDGRSDADDAAIATVRRTPPPKDPRWEQWLGAVATPAFARLPLETPGRQLAFLIDAAAGPLPCLKARAVWVSPTRQGRLGKPEPVVRTSLGDDADWSGLSGDQHDLLAHLRMGGMDYSQSAEWYRLSGTRGEAVLRRLLAGAVCFWQKPLHGPIAMVAARALTWQWQVDHDGTQALTPQLPPGARLLRVDGLWCYDPASRQLGSLHGDADLAARLIAAPPLSPEQATAVHQRWQRLPKLQPFPAPEAFAKPQRIRATPTPILRLHALTLPSLGRRGDDRRVPCARLSFDYAGHRVDPAAPDIHARRVEAGTLLVIERDAGAERAAVAALSRCDVSPALTRPDLRWQLHGQAGDADFVCMSYAGADEAERLLHEAQAMQTQGFRLEFDPTFPIELTAAPERWQLDAGDAGADNAWFDLALGIDIEGERVALLPILRHALLDRSVTLQPTADEPADAIWLAPLDDRRRVPLPLAQIRALLEPLLQWLEGSHGDALRLPRVAVGVLDDLSADSRIALQTHTSKGLIRLTELLRDGGRTRRVALPKGLKADLRDYQRDGLDWLGFLADAGLGGVLADDMGLGKTVQVLAHVLGEKQSGRMPHPVLVVTPTSVVANWREQAARFTPSLRVCILHGLDRHPQYATLADCDIAITTYALLARDRDALVAQAFSLAVFDEAQAIKNPRAKAALTARELQTPRRLAVTGTPLENHLGELWTQFDCVLPGLLGDARQFGRSFRTPIEKHGDAQRQAQLNRRTAPFILRRNKEQVARELPAKTEIVQHIELSGSQRTLYETLRLAMHDKVQRAIARRGLAQSSIVILDALLKLRQACCDPRLVKLDAGRRVRESAKLEALLPMLEELLAEGRRILLFSQFTQMLDLIQAELQQRKIAFLRLDGSTRDRDTPVKRFQAGDCPLFLISLKAGGVGLNLTAADSVIHYDPWWNPAVERQATDRAHRIGQTRPVFVYKLICAGTVEEKIQAMQQRKAALAQAVLEGGSRASPAFEAADVAALFAPL